MALTTGAAPDTGGLKGIDQGISSTLVVKVVGGGTGWVARGAAAAHPLGHGDRSARLAAIRMER